MQAHWKKHSVRRRLIQTCPQHGFCKVSRLICLGRPAEASAALQQAHKLGLRGPSLDYEIGWAAIFVGNWGVAVEHLQRYEAAKPGSGRVGTSLGLALLGQGKLNKAEAKLRKAMERDPSRKPSALYLLSQIEGARGDIPAARQHLKRIMIETPDSRLGRALWGGLASEVQRAQAEGAETPRKPWRVSASLSGGYNDNVVALGDGLPLPTDISSKDSPFTQFALGASYDQLLSPDDAITYGYTLNSNFYSDVDGFDVIDQYFYLRYSRRLRHDLIATLTGSDQYTLVDSEGFRNELALRPALLYQINEYSTVELAYRFAFSDYFSDVAIGVLDRDAKEV